MAWHKWAFYTSLAVWVIAMLFVNPEQTGVQRSASRRQQQNTSWPSWQNFLVTLISVAIMFLGYSKLGLFYDETSDALVASRNSQDPYRVYGVNAPHPDEITKVSKTFVECHDRLNKVLSNCSQEVHHLEESLQQNIRLLVEDIDSYYSDIGMVMRGIEDSKYVSKENLRKRAVTANSGTAAEGYRMPVDDTNLPVSKSAGQLTSSNGELLPSPAKPEAARRPGGKPKAANEDAQPAGTSSRSGLKKPRVNVRKDKIALPSKLKIVNPDVVVPARLDTGPNVRMPRPLFQQRSKREPTLVAKGGMLDKLAKGLPLKLSDVTRTRSADSPAISPGGINRVSPAKLNAARKTEPTSDDGEQQRTELTRQRKEEPQHSDEQVERATMPLAADTQQPLSSAQQDTANAAAGTGTAERYLPESSEAFEVREDTIESAGITKESNYLVESSTERSETREAPGVANTERDTRKQTSDRASSLPDLKPSEASEPQ